MSSRTPTEQRASRRRFFQSFAAVVVAGFALFSPKARAHDSDWDDDESGIPRGHDKDKRGQRRGHERHGGDDDDRRGRGHRKGHGKGHGENPPPPPPPPPTTPPPSPPPPL